MFHVDIDPAVPAANVKGATPVVSDAADFLSALVEALGGPTDSARAVEDARALVGRAHASLAAAVAVEEANVRSAGDTWVSPAVLVRALQAVLPDATYASDSGNGTTYVSEALRTSVGCRYMGPVNYSSMGFSVPAGIGACLALATGGAATVRTAAPSERFVVVLVGDGALRMTGPELASAVR